MKRLLTLVAILVTACVYTQNCEGVALENIPGKWTPGLKSSIGISGAELVKARSVTDNLDNHFRTDYPAFKGLYAQYFSAFEDYNPYNGNDLAQYYYSLYFSGFYCHDNKVLANPDRYVSFRIKLNETGITFTHDALVGEWDENEKDHFGWIDNFPDQKDGVIYMKATPDSAQFTVKPERWLLTYQDKLPYAYVTRFEYLQALKSKLNKAAQKGIDDLKAMNPIRPKAEQDKEKEEALKKFKEDAANGLGDWTDRYLQNYRTDEQMQEENIRATTEMYNRPLQKVDDYLRRPDNELRTAAVISTISEFNGFINEGDIGAMIVVKGNPSYYDENIGKAVPQIIYVTLDMNSKEEKYVSTYSNIIKRLDFEMLKNLLGK